MADNEQPELITHAQAAQILGCGVSNIPKLISKGFLESSGKRGPRPSLKRSQVKALLAERTAQKQAQQSARDDDAANRERGSREPPPDDGPLSRWLTAGQAADVIGITAQAVRQRCRRGTIPHQTSGEGSAKQYWIRADHARIAAHVRATNGPETVAITLDGID